MSGSLEKQFNADSVKLHEVVALARMDCKFDHFCKGADSLKIFFLFKDGII